MTVGAKLGWLVAVCVALLVGFGTGVWVGGEIEADVHMDFLMSAELPQECWDKIEAAAQKVIEDYEGGGGGSNAP